MLAADASGISKDLFVSLWVMGACLINKARDKPDLVWSTLHIIASRIILGCS